MTDIRKIAMQYAINYVAKTDLTILANKIQKFAQDIKEIIEDEGEWLINSTNSEDKR